MGSLVNIFAAILQNRQSDGIWHGRCACTTQVTCDYHRLALEQLSQRAAVQYLGFPEGTLPGELVYCAHGMRLPRTEEEIVCPLCRQYLAERHEREAAPI
ncbi:MAG TPA: hypothetical protein VMU80_13360 [Bryobacteraceae bacterium]|nr:hypothetical protein [Bryobacteraceae bacterium]